MGSFDSSITQLLQLQSFTSRLRKRLLGDPRAELAASITDHLLVFGESLYHLESGSQLKLDLDPVTGSPSASSLAGASRQLLGITTDKQAIKLLLAPIEFVGTSQSMPGVTADNLESALSLQKDSLLPAYDNELELAVAESRASASNDIVTAIWLPRQRLDELFLAFGQEKLFLAAVQPRNLGQRFQGNNISVLDDDGQNLSAVTWQDGVLCNWMQSRKTDLEQDAFNDQWMAATQSLPNVNHLNAETLAICLQSEPRRSTDYSFFPAGALAARKKVEKRRQLVLAASVVVGLLALSSLPFILQTLELRMAQARLQSVQELSAEARADQSVVVNFENEWGTINDFPDQQVRAAMFQLQEVLGAEQLSSLELSEGLIRIQGTSADPQAILQRLEQDPMFTEVVFSRATNNTRYYIDLRLATVNFEAYMLRYFPDES